MLTSRLDQSQPTDDNAEQVRASREMARDVGAVPPPFAPLALKGNPEQLASRRRAVRVMIRFHHQEAAAVRERARRCGVAFARYIREVSLGAIPRERRHRSVDELIHQLARIGNNLNQLAHEAHARDDYPGVDRVETVLTQLRGVIHQVATDGEPHR